MPRTSLRMYLSSTVGAFLAVGSTAGGGPVPAGFDPDDAGFFLPKSGMSAKTHLLCQAITLFRNNGRTLTSFTVSMINSIHSFHRAGVVDTSWLVGTALVGTSWFLLELV